MGLPSKSRRSTKNEARGRAVFEKIMMRTLLLLACACAARAFVAPSVVTSRPLLSSPCQLDKRGIAAFARQGTARLPACVTRRATETDVEGSATEASAKEGGAVEPPADLQKSLGLDFAPPQETEKGVDPQQVRVIAYVLLSLIPCLFLLPLVGSNELIPLDPSLMQQ